MEKDYKYYSSEQKKYFLSEMYNKKNFSYWIENNIYKILIAEIGEELIGFLVADKTFGGVGFITWLGVSSTQRIHGIGSELLLEYEKFVKTQGGHLIEAYTKPEVEEFYLKNGYKKIGERKKGYFSIPNVIMDKEII